MFLRNFLVLGVVLGLFLQSQCAMAVEPLTKEDLTPFCQNQMIWGQFKVTEEQCLAASIPCSQKIATTDADMMQATQALYNCVFSKLGIDMPMSDE